MQDVKQWVRQIALSLPEVVESTSYGTPSFKLKEKMLARFHEDGVYLVMKMDFETRDFMLQAHPDIYFITDHYKNYPYVLIRLASVDPEELRGHFWSSWKSYAPKKLLKSVQLPALE